MVEMTTLLEEPAGVRGQALNPVEFGEEAVVVGRAEVAELCLGLLPEISAIDQEENAAGAAELDETIQRGDGQQRFA